MTSYSILKLIHVSAVILTFIGFVVRGIWMIQSSKLLHTRFVKIAPHIIDTILLVSAIALVLLTAQYPIYKAWINAKIIGLIAYIVLGLFALRLGKTKTVRIVAWLSALAVFLYITLVAIYRNATLMF